MHAVNAPREGPKPQSPTADPTRAASGSGPVTFAALEGFDWSGQWFSFPQKCIIT